MTTLIRAAWAALRGQFNQFQIQEVRDGVIRALAKHGPNFDTPEFDAARSLLSKPTRQAMAGAALDMVDESEDELRRKSLERLAVALVADLVPEEK